MAAATFVTWPPVQLYQTSYKKYAVLYCRPSIGPCLPGAEILQPRTRRRRTSLLPPRPRLPLGDLRLRRSAALARGIPAPGHRHAPSLHFQQKRPWHRGRRGARRRAKLGAPSTGAGSRGRVGRCAWRRRGVGRCACIKTVPTPPTARGQNREGGRNCATAAGCACVRTATKGPRPSSCPRSWRPAAAGSRGGAKAAPAPTPGPPRVSGPHALPCVGVLLSSCH